MKTGLLIIIGSIIGTIVVFVFLGLYLYGKLKQHFSPEELSEFGKAFKGEVMSDKEAYSTKKTILGLTDVLEKQIKRDFPDFNVSQLFKELETDISSYLAALTDQSVEKIPDDKMVLLKEEIRQEVLSMKASNIKKQYKDVYFTKHVLKDYKKSNGTATLKTQSQASYLYDSNVPKEKKYKNMRKETLFTCEFVYITDEKKYGSNAITTRCPNCGASHTAFDGGNCAYCGTYIKPVEILKIWRINNIKEEKY